MPVSDEMVEMACAAEQKVTGRYKWPDEWLPELAAEYRAGMRTFLVSILPCIEASVFEQAARVADEHSSASDPAAQIAASLRSRITVARMKAAAIR